MIKMSFQQQLQGGSAGENEIGEGKNEPWFYLAASMFWLVESRGGRVPGVSPPGGEGAAAMKETP